MSDAAKQETALALSRSIPERTIEGIVLLNQAGRVCWTRRYPEAKAIAEEAAGIFKQLHNLWGYARARRQIGVTVQDLENPKAALPYFQEVIVLTERPLGTGDAGNGARQHRVGVRLHGRGRNSPRGVFACGGLSRRTGSIWVKHGSPMRSAKSTARLDNPNAPSPSSSALPLTREAGATMDEGVTLVSMGQVYGRFGNWERSIEYRNRRSR